MSGIIFANYRAGGEQFALQRSANKLAQDIRRTQQMAMSAKEYNQINPPGGYGVYLTMGTPGGYILFADCDSGYDYDAIGTPCNGVPELVEEIEFESGVNISSLSPSPLTITFTPPDPEIRVNGSLGSSATITLTIDTKSQMVTVNAAGLIEIQ